jgi:sugar phosphate isomerase/epimerase
LGFPKVTKLVAEAGFSALDISPWIPRNLSRALIRSLRRSLTRNDLAFSGFLAIYPPEMTLASESPSVREKNISYTKWLIELAYDLGGRVLIWGSPRSRIVPRGISLRRAYGWFVELLNASASLADETDIKIAIEPINRFESTIIHNVGVVYDTFHASLEEDSFIDPILLSGKRLAAVHVSDCNRRIPGKGHIDFAPIFAALKRAGYDGYVTLEAILDGDLRTDLVAARRYLEKMID